MKLNINVKSFIILGLVIALLGILFWYVRFKAVNTNVEKNYKAFAIPDFTPGYKNDIDFTILNELDIKSSDKNIVFLIKKDENLVDKIRTGALKLGLSKESVRQDEKIYAWVKDDTLYDSSIVFYEKTGRIDIKYSNGINTQPIEAENSYKYLTDFFSLSVKDYYLDKVTTMGDAQIVTFGRKVESKDLLFNKADKDIATIVISKGKIVDVQLIYTTSAIEKEYDLKPITKINRQNLSSLYYFTNITPQNSFSRSQYGSEPQPGKNMKVSIKLYEEVYYYYILGENKYFLPALKILGDYIDESNNKGTFTLIVVNQDIE